MMYDHVCIQCHNDVDRGHAPDCDLGGPFCHKNNHRVLVQLVMESYPVVVSDMDAYHD
jgi:hypothetical protein